MILNYIEILHSQTLRIFIYPLHPFLNSFVNFIRTQISEKNQNKAFQLLIFNQEILFVFSFVLEELVYYNTLKKMKVTLY